MKSRKLLYEYPKKVISTNISEIVLLETWMTGRKYMIKMAIYNIA